jgi:type II secretory pathway pseudopilin PulG
MIELVFVIVIIGILAAVALPRFTGISDDAHVSKLQAFVGTLNRTVGASLWSGIQRNDQAAAGSVASSTYNSNQYATIDEGDEVQAIPSELRAPDGTTSLGTPPSIALPACAASTTAAPAIGDPAPTTGIIAKSVTIGSDTYEIGCIDSNLNQSPRFWLAQTGGTVITN